METSRISDGIRAGLPLALAPLLFGASFGLLAVDAGMGGSGRSSMSATTFAGSAQFAAASILDDGGGALAAIVAAILLNARYVPLSLAVASIFPGSRRRRFLESQLIVDESWALVRPLGPLRLRDPRRRRHPALRPLGRRHRDRHRRRRPARPGGDRPRRGVPGALPRPARRRTSARAARSSPPSSPARSRSCSCRSRRRACRSSPPASPPDRAAPVTWLVIAVVGVVTMAFKASGPVLLGRRELPPRVTPSSRCSRRRCWRRSSSRRRSAATGRSCSTSGSPESSPAASRSGCARRSSSSCSSRPPPPR